MLGEPRPKGLPAALARHGSVRSFVLRTLYSWFTLTILFTFTWPLLVVYFDAPAVSIDETPLDWFQVRFLLLLLTAIAAGWLWWVSPAPVEVANPERFTALFRRGKAWPQAIVFLVGLSLLLALLLVLENPAGGGKVVAFGLVEAALIQVLLAGYMQSFFELVLDDARSYLASLGLFALTFAIRGGLASTTQDDLGQDLFVVALLAGAVVGLVAGGLSLFLRARSGSIVPAVFVYWLLFSILPALFEG
ncbi:MAG: hypothetical protein DCC58_02645 [Chloroflexi bacterium]|nr:MAG: hypothetical protein DCC58_02645 [Chloroflexota bacterium]